MEIKTDKATVVWSSRPAWSEYVFLWAFVAILAVRGLLMLRIEQWQSALNHLAGVILLTGLAVFLRQTTHYRLTREAVYRTKGLLGRGEEIFPLKEIASVSVRQGPLDRLFGIGALMLHFKDGRLERLAGVGDPDQISRKITALL
jgi:membrane protein YdbS with pleckstrin-like domain